MPGGWSFRVSQSRSRSFRSISSATDCRTRWIHTASESRKGLIFVPEQVSVAFVGCTHPHIFPRIDLLRAEPNVTLVGCYDPDTRLSNALERDHGLKAFPTA